MFWSKLGMFGASVGFASSVVSITIGKSSYLTNIFGVVCLILFMLNLYMLSVQAKNKEARNAKQRKLIRKRLKL